MYITYYISLLLALAIVVTDGRRLDRPKVPSKSLIKPRSVRRAKQRLQDNSRYKDMLLTRIDNHSYHGKNRTIDREMSFHWKDPNSNTSTYCNASWSDSNITANYPTSYIVCNATGNQELFQWYFSSYTNGGQFTLQLAHMFQDPKDFPPPWDMPDFFSTTAVKLNCVRNRGIERCRLPANSTVVRAVIDGVSD